MINSELQPFLADWARHWAELPQPADAVQVLSILEARGMLAGVNVVKIENKTEAETAAILRESLIFLSFAAEEGWSLPPMEAMACGCITIGYDGRGGREYFTSQNGFPIRAEDVIGFAATVERVLKQFESDPRPLHEMMTRTSNSLRQTYTPAREEQDILATWEQILQLPSLPPVPV